jgi:hypothetical protein
VASITIYRPGEIVPRSGLYNVVNSLGDYQGRQDTFVQGTRFSPVMRPNEYGYVLADPAVHRY